MTADESTMICKIMGTILAATKVLHLPTVRTYIEGQEMGFAAARPHLSDSAARLAQQQIHHEKLLLFLAEEIAKNSMTAQEMARCRESLIKEGAKCR